MLSKLKSFSPKQKNALFFVLVLACAVAYCAPPGTFRTVDFELVGTTRDSETKEPI